MAVAGEQARRPHQPSAGTLPIASRTSLGEAAARTKAADPSRRETNRVRTGHLGLRGDSKRLASGNTPCSAKPQRQRMQGGIRAVFGVDRTPFSAGEVRCGVPTGGAYETAK